MLSLLAAEPLDGVLEGTGRRCGWPRRRWRAATPERAEGALVGVDARTSWPRPVAVWLMRARVEEAAGHRAHALDAYRRLYYDYPLSDGGGGRAGRAVADCRTAGEVRRAETERALARAERCSTAPSAGPTRAAAFAALRAGVNGDAARAGVALRIAAVRLLPRQPPGGARGAGGRCSTAAARRRGALLLTCWPPRRWAIAAAYEPLARKLVGDYPRQPVGRGGAERAWPRTSSRSDEDDEADEVFRELLRAYPARPLRRARGVEGGLARLSRRRVQRGGRDRSSRRRPTSRAPTPGRPGSTGPAAPASA